MVQLSEVEESLGDIDSHLSSIDKREDVLGFKPQKEIIYNALLPYAARLDQESNVHLAEIKSQIGRTILLRDVKIGGIHWIGQLSKYIRLYGMKFSLEDHIQLIHLLFEVLSIPGLQFSLIQKYAVVLTTLLKKRELIPRKSLVLPWRPLYELVDKIVNSAYEHHGMVFFPDNIENTLKGLVRVCRVYFSAESTQEMLDEWRPLMCPFDIKMGHAMFNFEIFLPTLVYPEEHDKTFKLWFGEFISIYSSTVNVPSWEQSFVNLFARLASDCIGYVDWEPYLDQIFTRILRDFNLPVGSKKVEIRRGVESYEVSQVARWMVSMISPASKVQSYICKLFKALLSYYHPSNHGMWSIKLLKLLSRLSAELVERLFREDWRSTSSSNKPGQSKFNEREFKKTRKEDWRPKIPEEVRMTEEQITSFVECICPALMSGVFSKSGSAEAATTFKNLSTIRPEIVIPPILEWTYTALEALTEPHRLIACLQCMASVMRSMVLQSHRYPEGPSNVIPLLRLSLPGIDPNDLRKSLMTFQLITTLTSLIPIVDCSEAPLHHKDLTKHEKDLCSATAEFEGVVLQYFDRIISLIENSAHHHSRTDTSIADRMSNEEVMLELCLLSSTNSLLQQTSLLIFEEVLKKLRNFALGSVFETRVAGKFTSKLIKAAARVRPELVLSKFVEHSCSLLIKRLQSEDLSNDEHLDNEILWHLLLLSEVVVCNGKYLLPYGSSLTTVLELTLDLKCKDAAELSLLLLRNVLKSLSTTYAVDYRCTINDWDSPISECLPIRDWGKSSDLFNLRMKWHEPSPQERGFVRQLLSKFLLCQLDKIALHCSKDESVRQTMGREELLRRLNVVLQCIIGSCALLPVWNEGMVPLAESPVPLTRFPLIASSNDEVVILRDKNVRLLIADRVLLLLDHMFSDTEDDTKGLIVITKIINTLLHAFSSSKEEFDGRWKARHHIKHFMENKLLGKKKHIRSLLVDRIQLQHDLRSTNQSMKQFTKHHQTFYEYLFRLSTSRYMEVRKAAQAALASSFRVYAYSYQVILKDIFSILGENPTGDVKHHQFKGALYVILGESKQSLASRRNWDLMNRLWPALILTPHCNKPSLNIVYDAIIDRIHKDIETIEIMIEVTPACIKLAETLWTGKSSLKCSTDKPSAREMEDAVAKEKSRNESNLKSYLKLVGSLVEIAQTDNLYWKFQQVCFELLSLMIRHDVLAPRPVVELFVRNTNNTMINIRKISIHSLSALLKQQKRAHLKAPLDLSCKTLPFRCSRLFQVGRASSIVPVEEFDRAEEIHSAGVKKQSSVYRVSRNQVRGASEYKPPLNNDWLLFWKKQLPITEEEWGQHVFVNKTHVGYYGWPKPMLCYKPFSDQPKLGRQRSELSEHERPIYDSFTNQDFVKEFIKYISMEELKGKETFHPKHFTLFKGLFRNFDDTLLTTLKDHIETLVSDVSHESQESNHRCAAEIIAGLLRGSKHWDFKKRENMWSWLIPVLGKVLYNLSVENFNDWGTCIATASENQDPRKLAPLFDLLMENPLNEVGGSFGDSSRLYLVQGLLAQQEWRVPELLHKLLNFLYQHLRHLYKNVRDRIGSLLVNIFLFDVSFYPKFPSTINPQLGVFLELLLPQLLPLTSLGDRDALMVATDSEPQNASLAGATGTSDLQQQESSLDDIFYPSSANITTSMGALTNPSSLEENQKSLIRLLKTILKGLQGVYTRLFQTDHPEVLKLLPVMAALGSYTADPELSKECVLTMTIISHGLLQNSMVLLMLDAVEEVSRMSSWHARSAILNFLQRLTFGNLFLLQDPAVVSRIRTVLLHLILDEQLEVRELAGVTLSGFFQCGYFPVDEDILGHFRALASRKLNKKAPVQHRSGPTLVVRPTGVVVPAVSASTPFPVCKWNSACSTAQDAVDLNILKRHAGVIGMCACVSAAPYDVPNYVPDVLVVLSAHLNDPQPIQMTVKKALASFKRTHHENWHDLKDKFTDDQLATLTELLVSPNYYA